MILSKEFYDLCCPSYKKVIDEIEEKLAATKNVEEALEIVITFSKNYLIPKEYWGHCLEGVRFNTDNASFEKLSKLCCEAVQRAFFHLHYDIQWHLKIYWGNLDLYEDIYVKLIQFRFESDMEKGAYHPTERDITFPHSYLKECFSYFKWSTTRLPSKKVIQRYKRMRELYSKIESAKDNVEEWFKLLYETGDIDFFKHNVEERLSRDYFDVNFWKLYIAFLKEVGEYELCLEVYSKYCRFFLEDLEMKDMYQQAMIEYGSSNTKSIEHDHGNEVRCLLPWDNLFDFEITHTTVKPKECQSDDEKKEVLPFDKSLCAAFHDTYQVQNFSLRRPLIRYILMNANVRTLQKLFNSCKYFFAKKSTPLCYCIETTTVGETCFTDERLTLKSSKDPNQDLLINNIHLTGIVRIGCNKTLTTLMSSLIPRIYRCEATIVKLLCQNLSFHELKFLIQSGCVVYLSINYCEIKDENDGYVDLEKIMEFLPNIKELTLSNTKVNANTVKVLSKFKFSGKLSYFSIYSIYGGPFDPNEFIEFFIKIKTVKTKLRMSVKFSNEFDAAFENKFFEIKKNLKNSIQAW